MVQRLQGCRITLSQQDTEMDQLSVRLIVTIGVLCPLSDEAAATIDSNLFVVRDLWCAEIVFIRNYFEDMGIFDIQLLQYMNDEVTTRLVTKVSFLIFDILKGIIDIVAMRDKGNQACEQDISSTMYHELVAIPGRDVGRLVFSQIGRPHFFCSDKDINQITAQHRALVAAINVAQEF